MIYKFSHTRIFFFVLTLLLWTIPRGSIVFAQDSEEVCAEKLSQYERTRDNALSQAASCGISLGSFGLDGNAKLIYDLVKNGILSGEIKYCRKLQVECTDMGSPSSCLLNVAACYNGLGAGVPKSWLGGGSVKIPGVSEVNTYINCITAIANVMGTGFEQLQLGSLHCVSNLKNEFSQCFRDFKRDHPGELCLNLCNGGRPKGDKGGCCPTGLPPLSNWAKIRYDSCKSYCMEYVGPNQTGCYSTSTTTTKFTQQTTNYAPTTSTTSTTNYVPTTTKYVSTTTKYIGTTVRYIPTTTRYMPTTTKYIPTTTKYTGTTVRYTPTSTRYLPTTTTKYMPTTTRYTGTTVRYTPTTTKYLPTTTK